MRLAPKKVCAPKLCWIQKVATGVFWAFWASGVWFKGLFLHCWSLCQIKVAHIFLKKSWAICCGFLKAENSQRPRTRPSTLGRRWGLWTRRGSCTPLRTSRTFNLSLRQWCLSSQNCSDLHRFQLESSFSLSRLHKGSGVAHRVTTVGPHVPGKRGGG